MGKHRGCFFCGSYEDTKVMLYRHGTTGKRGSYRRRMCGPCQQARASEIRGPYPGEHEATTNQMTDGKET